MGMVVLALASVLVLLLLVAVIRAATLKEADYPEFGMSRGDREELPSWYLKGMPELMAKALAIPTVSSAPGDYDRKQLLRFHHFLRESFPDVFNKSYIKVETVNTYSLLFTITGSETDLQPYMLTGHMDVVPVVKERWTHDPWGGLIIPDADTGEDYIWGRGAIDNKLGVMGIMMALQYLAQTDFQPSRSFYVAFGHDEEVSGIDGAGHIGKLLQERNVELDFLLDEGMPIVDDIMKGISSPVAIVGVTEKGHMTLKLEVEGEGGHSSMPPLDSAVKHLASALHNLDQYQQPILFGQGPEADTFAYLAPKASWPYKLVYANLWLFRPLLALFMSRSRDTNTFIRTTTATTIVRSGFKENVVPTTADAVINHRIHPAQSVDQVIQHDLKVIDDPLVKVTVLEQMEAHPVSPYGPEDPGWRLVSNAIHHHFPSTTVAPGVMVANTDTLHYLHLTRRIYRLTPVIMTKKSLPIIHGDDERIPSSAVAASAGFFHHIISAADRQPKRPLPHSSGSAGEL